MEWQIERYAHVSGICLDPEQAVALGDGRLRCLPFDEWRAFVGRHVEQSQRHFERHRPAFYVDRLSVDDEAGIDLEQELKLPFTRLIERQHAALVYTLAASLPSPLHSTRYLLSLATRQRWRDIGERDIEWMIYGAWDSEQNRPIDASQVPRLRCMLGRLETLGAGPETPELQRVLDVMKLAAEAPLEPLDVLVHAVIALEDVLNPRADRPLGREFARPGSILAAVQYGQLEEAEWLFGALYRIRSKCLHGEDPSAAVQGLRQRFPNPLAAAFLACGRVAEVLAQCLAECGPAAGAERLLAELAAVEDRASFQRFRDRRELGWFHR